MKTVLLAVLVFGAAFGGVFAYGWLNTSTGERAIAEEEVKDAIVAELGGRPEPTPETGEQTLAQAYQNLLRAYGAMNATCSAEDRPGYAVAFAGYIEAVDRANATHAESDVEVDGMAIMNQFMYVASHHIIEASDMPSRRFRNMVAAIADSHDNPSEEQRELDARMQISDWYRNDAGDVMVPSPCTPLSAEG